VWNSLKQMSQHCPTLQSGLKKDVALLLVVISYLTNCTLVLEFLSIKCFLVGMLEAYVWTAFLLQ
jgi:hypothetical protein